MKRLGHLSGLIAAGAVLAALALYGLWFHVSAGPVHGGGLETAIVCGIGAALCAIAAWVLARPLKQNRNSA